MLDVLIVAGARPNFMKVKPVLDAVEDLGLSTLLMHTEQHYDAQTSDVCAGRGLEVGPGLGAVVDVVELEAVTPRSYPPPDGSPATMALLHNGSRSEPGARVPHRGSHAG